MKLISALIILSGEFSPIKDPKELALCRKKLEEMQKPGLELIKMRESRKRKK